MLDPFAAADAVIRGTFGEPVIYFGGGLSEPTEVSVIWSDEAGDTFQGPGNTTRTISCEIATGSLKLRPIAADRIARRGVTWKPQQVIDRDDINAWVVTLEQV